MTSPDRHDAPPTMRASAPARPARPAVPPGPHAAKRRGRSAGLAVSQATAAPLAVARRPGCGAEVLLPNTGPVTCTAGAPFGTWGAYVNMAAPANDTYLTRLQVRRTTIPGALANMAVEFAYGAGPTSLDIVRGCVTLTDPTLDSTGYLPFDLNTFNTKVPAGQQLQCRASEVNAGTWEVWACGWDGAVPTFTPLAVAAPAGAGRCYPTNVSAGLSVIAGLLPAYGAWVQVVAAAPNDMLVVAVQYASLLASLGTVGTAWQLGIGPAGAEVPVGTFLSGHLANTVNCDPPVLVLAGERLAIRAAQTAAGGRLVIVKVIDL